MTGTPGTPGTPETPGTPRPPGPPGTPGTPGTPETPGEGHHPDPESSEERRMAALYGLGDPPPDDGRRNPFWWIWALVIPFILIAITLMVWRIMSTPQRTLPGL